MTFRDVLVDLLDTTASRYCAAPTPEDIKRLANPIFWVDGSGWFRCTACGGIHAYCHDDYFKKCSPSHEPAPLWIEQTRSGYKIFKTLKGRSSLFAHLPHDEWALSLAMAITAQQFWPQAVMPEQLPGRMSMFRSTALSTRMNRVLLVSLRKVSVTQVLVMSVSL